MINCDDPIIRFVTRIVATNGNTWWIFTLHTHKGECRTLHLRVFPCDPIKNGYSAIFACGDAVIVLAGNHATVTANTPAQVNEESVTCQLCNLLQGWYPFRGHATFNPHKDILCNISCNGIFLIPIVEAVRIRPTIKRRSL